jgi:hypothetical protein
MRKMLVAYANVARGNLDDDATCDEWSINDAGKLKHTVDDTKD